MSCVLNHENLSYQELVNLHKLTDSHIDNCQQQIKYFKEEGKLREEIINAARTLGEYYLAAGEHQDLPESFRQLRFATRARKEDPYINFFVAKLYMIGVTDTVQDNKLITLLPKSPVTAGKYLKDAISEFKKSSYQDDPYAHECLGFCYEHGLVYPQDLQKAIFHYQQAYKFKMNSAFDDIRRCQIELRKKESQLELSRKQFELAQSYHYGIGKEIDWRKSLELYRRGVNDRYAPAQAAMGFLFLNGLTVQHEMSKYAKRIHPDTYTNKTEMEVFKLDLESKFQNEILLQKDDNMAIQHFMWAANQGNSEGEYGMGRCFEKGRGIKENLNAARDWYLRSALKGHLASSYCLAKLCLKNKIGNCELGFEILQELSKLNYPQAQYDLGLIYYRGLNYRGVVVKKDVVLAYNLVKASAEQGYEPAKSWLPELEKAVKIADSSMDGSENYSDNVSSNNSSNKGVNNKTLEKPATLTEIIKKLQALILSDKVSEASQPKMEEQDKDSTSRHLLEEDYNPSNDIKDKVEKMQIDDKQENYKERKFEKERQPEIVKENKMEVDVQPSIVKANNAEDKLKAKVNPAQVKEANKGNKMEIDSETEQRSVKNKNGIDASLKEQTRKDHASPKRKHSGGLYFSELEALGPRLKGRRLSLKENINSGNSTSINASDLQALNATKIVNKPDLQAKNENQDLALRIRKA